MAERKTCWAGEGSLPGLAIRDRRGQARSDRAGFPMLAPAQEQGTAGNRGASQCADVRRGSQYSRFRLVLRDLGEDLGR